MSKPAVLSSPRACSVSRRLKIHLPRAWWWPLISPPWRWHIVNCRIVNASHAHNSLGCGKIRICSFYDYQIFPARDAIVISFSFFFRNSQTDQTAQQTACCCPNRASDLQYLPAKLPARPPPSPGPLPESPGPEYFRATQSNRPSRSRCRACFRATTDFLVGTLTSASARNFVAIEIFPNYRNFIHRKPGTLQFYRGQFRISVIRKGLLQLAYVDLKPFSFSYKIYYFLTTAEFMLCLLSSISFVLLSQHFSSVGGNNLGLYLLAGF